MHEIDFPRAKTDEDDLKLVDLLRDALMEAAQSGIAALPIGLTRYNATGAGFANIHLITAKIKKALDPNNIANPARLIDMEAMRKTEV